MDYFRKTPPSLVGLSGKRTPMNGINHDLMGMTSEEQLGLAAQKNGRDKDTPHEENGRTPDGKQISVDEKTKEMEFWPRD